MLPLQDQLAESLGKFWDERAIATENAPTSIGDLGVPMDSLTACDVMIDVEAIVGQTVPVDVVIQNGGYESRDQFIQQITDGVLKYLGK